MMTDNIDDCNNVIVSQKEYRQEMEWWFQIEAVFRRPVLSPSSSCRRHEMRERIERTDEERPAGCQ